PSFSKSEGSDNKFEETKRQKLQQNLHGSNSDNSNATTSK
ncbi:531_t:CDS:2, partial [Gigaspora margarita]